MRSLWFGRDLPEEFTDPLVREHLSFNGQLHFHCPACGAVTWGEVTVAQLLLQLGTDLRCPNCGREGLVPVRFVATESRACRRCGAQASARPEDAFHCTVCKGSAFDVIATTIDPPYPARLYVLFGRQAPFGLSAKDDVQWLLGYVRALRQSAQFHRHCIHLIAFIESLFRHVYASSADALDLLNMASGLMRTVYKETNDLDAAYLSIAIMMEGRDFASSPAQRAVFGLNINQNVYSVLARRYDPLLSIRFGFDLKEYGIQSSRRTVAEFEAIGEEWLAQLRARQKWLLGDILKSGDPSEAQIDEALHWLNEALRDPALPPEVADYVRESALAAQAKRRNLSVQERRGLQTELTALADRYLDQSDGLHRLTSLSEMLRTASTPGRDRRRELARRCLEDALRYTAANDPANMLRHAGTILAQLVAGFVAERFDAGRPLEGIAGAEAFRSLAIERGNVPAALGRPADVFVHRQTLEGLTGGVAGGDGAAAESLLSHHQDLLEQDIRSVCGGERTILWCEAWNGTLFTARIECDEGVSVRAAAHGLDETDARGAMELPLADAPPRNARAAEVRAALASGWKLFEPLLRELPAGRGIVFVGPSVLSGWPIDAAESVGRGGARVRPVVCAPTLRVAASARGSGKRLAARVLLVSYGGPDLPGIARETRAIEAIYGSAVTRLDGGSVSRTQVLEALKEPYEIIHLCGHGDFDYLEPMQSRLHFRPDGFVTAADILACGTIGRDPVVVMSACTSALVLPNGSNNFLGLAGALLRTGAVSIVGARWPIQDWVGAAFSEHFHARFAAGASVEEAVAHAKVQLGDAALDEWSAFMCVGG